jgi:hypothetical protein
MKLNKREQENDNTGALGGRRDGGGGGGLQVVPGGKTIDML